MLAEGVQETTGCGCSRRCGSASHLGYEGCEVVYVLVLQPTTHLTYLTLL